MAPSRGGPPAINYGNELSRERLPYSQVGFVQHITRVYIYLIMLHSCLVSLPKMIIVLSYNDNKM